MWEKSKFDINEEETKVRKNLSRLIHTLQHFPSKRSGLDTTSLWNIIDELESFNPDKKTKSVLFTHTTERKTFSKKYLNLRITGENVKTAFVPESSDTNQKFKNGKPVKKCCYKSSNNNSNQFKEKDVQKPKQTNVYECGPNKGKSFSNNTGIKINSKTLKNEEVRRRNFENTNSSTKHNNLQKNNQQKSENVIVQKKNILSSSKASEKKTDKIVNLIIKKSKTNLNSKEKNSCLKPTTKIKVETVRDESRSNKPNRNQMVNFKCKSHQCTPKANKALQQIILDNTHSSMDRSSVVKKLTNYWNNLLNNELEQYSSTESSGGSCQKVQIQDHSSQGAFKNNETQSETSISILKSRHLSESNINIMKRVDDLHSIRMIAAEQDSRYKPSGQINNTVADSAPVKSSVKMINEDYNILILDDKWLNDFNQSESLLNKNDAMEVLQNMFNELNKFPNCSIEPLIKKILYIMVTSSKLKSHHDTFLKNLEILANKMVQEIIQISQYINGSGSKTIKSVPNNMKNENPVGHISAFNKNQDIEMDYGLEESGSSSSTFQNKSSTIKHYKVYEYRNIKDEFEMHNCEITLDSGNSLVLATSRINLNKVENALNLFLMWREMIWSCTLHDRNDIEFSNYTRPPFQSFTIIFEEDIIFEEESTDEDFFTQDSSKDESMTNMDLYRTAVATIENYIDRIIDLFENCYPDSPEVLVRMIYQALVSVLIWWVIIKELFVK